MRFKNYLQEEYFTRVDRFEIFKNPSNREILSCWNQDNTRAIRALVDFENKIIFVFNSDMYHQVAAKQIASEKSITGVFHCVEVYERSKKIRVSLRDDAYKIKLGGSAFWGSHEEKDRTELAWVESKFKFLGVIEEEYLTRVKPKYIDKDVDCEIYKNPSIGELRTLDKEFRQIHKDMLIGRKGDIETLRFIFTDEDGPWYAATSMLLHSEIVKKAEVSYPGAEIRAMGWIEGGTLWMDAYSYSNWTNVIKKVLDQAGIKSQWRN